MKKGSEVLNIIIQNENETINSFSKKIGLKRPQSLYDVRDGKARYISPQLAEKINKAYPHYTIESLVSGQVEGNSLSIKGDNNRIHDINSGGNSTTKNYYSSECCKDKESIEIEKEYSTSMRPRIPIEVEAGSLAVIAEQGVKESDCLFFPKIGQFSDYTFTTIVRGDSMEPRYESGSEIACRKINGSKFIQWGRVHVLDTTQGAVIKQIFDDGDYIRCHSFNELYPDFLIPKDEIYSMSIVVGRLTFE